MSEIQTDPIFYTPWPKFGKRLNFQWGESRHDIAILKAVARAQVQDVETGDDEVNATRILAGLEFGEMPTNSTTFKNQFRLFYDKDEDKFCIQRNSGTEASPTWVDYLCIDQTNGLVTVEGLSAGALGVASEGGFYGLPDQRMQRIGEAGGAAGTMAVFTPDETRAIWFNSQDFYLTDIKGGVYAGTPVVNAKNSFGIARTFNASGGEWVINHNFGISPVMAQVFDNQDRVIIPGEVDVSNPDTAYFYFDSSISGKVIIATGGLGAAEIAPLDPFYLIVRLDNRSDVPRFDDFADLVFKSSDFYVDYRSPQHQAKISIAKSIAGESNTASNLGSGTGLFAQKSGVDLQFKSITGAGGLSISATATDVTITTTDGIGGGFYGLIVRESDSTPPSFRNDTLIFDSADFYLAGTSGNKPTVSLRQKLSLSYTHQQPTAAAEWTVNHNLAKTPVLTQAFNMDDKMIEADEIDVSDPNTAYFYFSQAVAGRAVAVGAVSAQSGEINTASNLGAGTGLFAQKVGNDLQFKSIVGSGGLSLSASSTEVTISTTDGIGGGFYGLYVRESDGNPPTFRNDTLIFDSNYFYLYPNSVGKPTVSIRQLTPGATYVHSQASAASEWVVTHNLNSNGFIVQAFDDQDRVIGFDQADVSNPMVSYFYFTQAITGKAVITTGIGTSGGEANTASNLGSGAGLFATKSVIDLQFKSLVAGEGIVINPSTNEVEISAEFYGMSIRETDGTPSMFRSQTIFFDSADFYLNPNSTGIPIVSSRGGSITNGENLGSGSGVFAQKSNANLQFKSLVAGSNIVLTPTANDITITVNSTGREFYGLIVKETAGDDAMQNDTLVFHSNYFYVTTSGELKPLVTLHEDQTFDNLTLNKVLTLTEQATAPATPGATQAVIWAEDSQGHTTIKNKDNDGQELVINRDLYLIVRNNTGTAIAAGKAVYVSGTTGNVARIDLAKADAQSTMPCVGITHAAIADNAFGTIRTFGHITGIDTSAFSAGDALWVSASTAGELTATEPSHPNYHQPIATAISSQVSGEILVNPEHADGDDAGTHASTFTIGTTAATSVVLTPSSTAQRTATFPNKSGTLAMTDDIGPGFYGLFVRESDGSPRTYKSDTLVFDSTDFYMSPTSIGEPNISLRVRTKRYVHSQESSNVEWIVAHSFGSNDIIFNAYDNRSIAITPSKADMSDLNTAYFYFSAAKSGKAVLLQV